MINDVHDLRRDVDNLEYVYDNMKMITYYKQTNSMDVAPVFIKEEWSTTFPTPQSDKYIWIVNLLNTLVGELPTNPVCIGTGVDEVFDIYSEFIHTASRSIVPLENDPNWSRTIEEIEGYVIWTRTTTKKSSGYVHSSPICISARNGVDGQTYYTWIKYSDVLNPTQSSEIYDNPKLSTISIGIATNKITSTKGTNPADYTWSKFKGDKGDNGADGVDGDNRYIWIKYSDVASPTSQQMYDIPTANTKYIGIAHNQLSPNESSNPSDYTWSKFKGEDGDDGQELYVWVKYSSVLNPTSSSEIYDTPTTYTISIGLAENKTSSTPSTNPSDYVWSRFRGLDGQNGQDMINPIDENIADSINKNKYVANGLSEEGSKALVSTEVIEEIIPSEVTGGGSIIFRRQGDIVSIMFEGIVEFSNYTRDSYVRKGQGIDLTEFAPTGDFFCGDQIYGNRFVMTNTGEFYISVVGSNQPILCGVYSYILNSKESTYITCNTNSIEYGESIITYLKKSSDNSGVEGQQIYLSINGVTYAITTDSNGQATLPTILTPSLYPIRLSSQTTKQYKSATPISMNVIITKINSTRLSPNADGSQSITYNHNFDKQLINNSVDVWLYTDTGHPLKYITVTTNFEGQIKEIMSDRNGKLTIPINTDHNNVLTITVPPSTHITNGGNFGVNIRR